MAVATPVRGAELAELQAILDATDESDETHLVCDRCQPIGPDRLTYTMLCGLVLTWDHYAPHSGAPKCEPCHRDRVCPECGAR